MSYGQRRWDNPINWSFGLGRMFGIDVRIHVTFVLCAIILVAVEMPAAGTARAEPFWQILVSALGTYAILFAIVLLHEFGHCFGARYTGGDADEVLLWPLGGLAYTNPPHRASAHLITAAAGPMVNVIICGVCSVVLAVWTGRLGAVPWNPFSPMWPADPTIFPTMAQLWVIRVFGISYVLLLFNLMPIFPFDGGRILQAWLWPAKGYQASMEIATSTGMIGAIILGLVSLFTEQTWLLLMIAVFGYVTCWQQRYLLREQAEFGGGEFGYDFSRGYHSLETQEKQRKAGWLTRLRARRAAARAERERKRQEQHHKAVEEVLRKISQSGLSSLSPRERRILEEETKRRQSLEL